MSPARTRCWKCSACGNLWDGKSAATSCCQCSAKGCERQTMSTAQQLCEFAPSEA